MSQTTTTSQLTCWDWNVCYPSTGIDKPLRLTKLEVGWIKAFALHIKRFVSSNPERFEAYQDNLLFDTYRRRVFVYWMNKNAEHHHAAEKQQRALLLEYRQLAKRREELTAVSCNDGWSNSFYE